MGTSAELAPIAFRGQEQRHSPRKRVSLPFALQLASGKQAWLCDIGEGGLGLSGSVGLETGTSARLQFRLPESGSSLDVMGTVAWSDDSGRAGIRFTQVESDSAVALLHWLSSEMGTSTQMAEAQRDAALEIKINCLREINELKAAISAQALDRDAALDLIVHRIAELTRASGAAIALQEDEDVICRARIGNAPDLGVKLSASSLSGECLRTGNVVLLEDSEIDPRVNPEVCRELNLRSLLILPIVSGSRNVGIAEALSAEPRNFQTSDILTISILNDLIASVAAPVFAEMESSAMVTLGDFEQMVAAAQQAEEPPPAARSQEFVAPEPPRSVASSPAEAVSNSHVISEPVLYPEVEPRPFQPEPISHNGTTAARELAFEPAAPAVTVPKAVDRAAEVRVATPARPRISLPIVAGSAAVALILTGFGINYAVRSNARAVKPAAQSTQSSLTIAATSPTAPPPASVAASAPANVSGAGTTKSAIHEAKAKPDTHSRSVESTEVEMNPARSGLSETTSEAAPEAPAIGQIAGSSSSGIAASIIAARTAAPELTPIQSQGVVEGKLIRKVLPHYPEMAKRAGVSGDVVLSATITTEGKLKNVRVVSGSPLLREEAMSAAKQWRYSPYLLGGKPVETETHITISFHR